MPRRQSNSYRNSQYIAKHTARAAAKSAEGVFRWAATDHTNFGQALQDNPHSDPSDRAKYIANISGIALGGIVLQAIWIFLLFAFVIPSILS
jgi:hypothetical protein